jgi:hypothetical protein
MAQIQFSLTKTAGGVLADTDWNTITFTPNGGGVARSITVVSNYDGVATFFNWAGQVYLGPTPTTTTITVTGVTGANAGASAQYVISDLQVVYVPVVP